LRAFPGLIRRVRSLARVKIAQRRFWRLSSPAVRNPFPGGGWKVAAGGDELELPMSRQDIADYLGLTIETVSRTMTQLENDAAIGLPTSPRIVLRNRAALGRLNA